MQSELPLPPPPSCSPPSPPRQREVTELSVRERGAAPRWGVTGAPGGGLSGTERGDRGPGLSVVRTWNWLL